MAAVLFGPIDANWILAYAAASLDDNPIHQAGEHQIGAPLVHGALLAALLERAALQLIDTQCLAETAIQFLEPVRQGMSVFFTLKRSRPLICGDRAARQFRLVGTTNADKICMMADCIAYKSDIRDLVS